MSAIRFEDISFVVQGPVDRTLLAGTGKPATVSCLESIRTWCPGAQIILSTWAGADVDGLDFDTLVMSDDPGAVNLMRESSPTVVYSNGNRQIVSTSAGLRQVRTKYAAKVRSDFVLGGNNWLKMYDRFPERSPEWRMFKERLITGKFYTRNPLREIRKPFHPSDWFMFGLAEDLLLMWDIPLEPEPESAHWFRDRPHPQGIKDRDDMRRYFAEQYVWKTLLEKFGRVNFENFGDASRENIRLTQLTFANNLIVLDKEQFPFEMHKYAKPRRAWRYACLSHREWVRLYRHHCCDQRAGALISRVTDLRHLLEGAYCMIPQSLRAGASKISGADRQPVQALPLKGSST